MEGRGAELLAAAQQLQPQRDSLVPLPGQQADVAGEERRLKDVCFVDVVVAVSREDLQIRNMTSQACPAPWTAASPSHPPHTWSILVFGSWTTVQDRPSWLCATLKALTNCTLPKSLAPCVMTPVIFLGDSRST